MCCPPPPAALHIGIGLGLAPYLGFLWRLVSASVVSGGPQPRIIAVSYKHVAMRLSLHIPGPEEVADDVMEHLARQVCCRGPPGGGAGGRVVCMHACALATYGGGRKCVDVAASRTSCPIAGHP